jgi:hypothetical protein
LSGSQFSLTGGDTPADSVLAALDSAQLSPLLPNPFSGGASGNLSNLGTCLQSNGIAIPLPLNKVTVSFSNFQVPGTTIKIPNGVVTGHAGVSFNVAGISLPPGDITQLPAFATAPKNFTRSGNFNCYGGPGFSEDDCKWTVADAGTNSYLSITGGSSVGTLVFIVPSLIPGQLNISGNYLVSPNAIGCNTGTEEAYVALASALPPSLYSALSTDDHDTVSSGSTSVNIGTANVDGQGWNFGMDYHNQCTRLHIDNLYGAESGSYSVSQLDASSLADTAISALASHVSVSNQNRLPDLTSAVDLASLTGLNGNFLSLLGAAGGLPGGMGGVGLAGVLSKGYLP